MINFDNGCFCTVDADGKQTKIGIANDIKISDNVIGSDNGKRPILTKKVRGTFKNVKVNNDFFLWLQIEHSRMLRHMYEFMESVKALRKGSYQS
ncbi:MAG: hypothetical protein K0Q53_102 [Massilibacillus sp.]|jgi:hypothetical protein|nr:hypothetical protein [Massilibacillus sp.]